MYKTKSIDGTNNICGKRIAECRKNMPGKVSQRMFAEMLCVAGFEIDKNAIQRIEAGTRFVTDIELRYIKNVLGVTYEDILD